MAESAVLAIMGECIGLAWCADDAIPSMQNVNT